MSAGSDDARPDEGRDEGWDETVLVWNATVVRITSPLTTSESPETLPGAPVGDGPASGRGRRPST